MSPLSILKHPAAFLPVVMSALALASVIAFVALHGTAPQQDEAQPPTFGSYSWHVRYLSFYFLRLRGCHSPPKMRRSLWRYKWPQRWQQWHLYSCSAGRDTKLACQTHHRPESKDPLPTTIPRGRDARIPLPL